jgi:hypothetical protein
MWLGAQSPAVTVLFYFTLLYLHGNACSHESPLEDLLSKSKDVVGGEIENLRSSF